MEREKRITQIESAPGKGNQFHVYIDDALAFTVHEDVLVQYRLWKDRTISERELEEIAREEERLRAYHDALAFVSRRPCSAVEIRRKLRRKKYPDEWIEEAVHRLQSRGYLNDGEFAKMLANQRVRGQLKGSRWIRQELAQKGIAKEHVADALESIDEEAEYEAALKAARKRWKPDSGDPKQRLKLFQYLVRRGFPHGIVRRALREATADTVEWDDAEME